MSVATAVAAVAGINATTPIAFVPLQGYFTLPPAVAATVPPPAARDPLQSPARRRTLRRRANVYKAEVRQEARIYSWASRRFLSADLQSETVSLSKHGNSIYGTSGHRSRIRDFLF